MNVQWAGGEPNVLTPAAAAATARVIGIPASALASRTRTMDTGWSLSVRPVLKDTWARIAAARTSGSACAESRA